MTDHSSHSHYAHHGRPRGGSTPWLTFLLALALVIGAGVLWFRYAGVDVPRLKPAEVQADLPRPSDPAQAPTGPSTPSTPTE